MPPAPGFLDDHGRLQLVAQIGHEHTGIDVVAAAHAEADDDLDGLTLVEIGGRLRGGGLR
jgi:hypothetical protein